MTTSKNNWCLWGCIWCLFKQKLEGHPLTVVGDGSQTRDFLYVEDVCNAFYMSANSEKSKNQIYNLG